jgi:hypothetical protein
MRKPAAFHYFSFLYVFFLYLAFASVLLVGQAPGAGAGPAWRFEQLGKKYPELMPPPPRPLGILQSRCVYPSPGTKTLEVKPCPANSRRPRLVPSLEDTVPPARPVPR